MTESLRPPFRRVALVGKINHEATRKTLQKLEQMLLEQDIELTIESRTAEQLNSTKAKLQPLDCLGEHADLAVVVGGDGNMLGAARALCEAQIAVIGVNRGNLGFLTDLDPDHVCSQLQAVLAGKYQVENRFLVQAEIYRDGEHVDVGRAINEVVLHSDKVAHMIEFEVFVDNEFAFSQRSDGLIVSTPTGSTAYSLSGGGPILTPGLNAISLISMFPHALSARPLVIDADSTVRLRTPSQNDKLQISCDGHVRMTVEPGDEVVISKHPHLLRMVHPQDHSYYRVLRNKLGWGSRLF